MRFSIDHTFQRTSLERYLEVYFSDAFNRYVDPEIGVEVRQRLERREQDRGQVYTRTRVVPAVKLPGPLRKMTGRVQIEYLEVCTFDPDKGTLDFCIEHDADRHLRVWGVVSFQQVTGGVRRVLELNVEVDVPLVRRLVERFIKSELRKSYARKAALMQRWLDELGGAAG